MPPHPIEDASADSLFGGLTAEEFYRKHGVTHNAEWMINERGMRLFTQSWEPTICSGRSKGLLVLLHGFTGNSSWTVQLTAIGLAAHGYSVHALDHQGHGRSDGLRAHIPDVAVLVDDCAQLALRARRESCHPGPYFYMGESLGGALALLLHLNYPALHCDGVVLVGAMCGISPAFQPPRVLVRLLGVAATLIPTLPIVPTKAIPQLSFKEPWKLELVLRDPDRIMLRPRPATALALLRAATEIQQRAKEVQAPLLVTHGEEDVVCDPEGARTLFNAATSSDKTLRMYSGMWHQLVGEPKPNVDIVFSDICSWLDTRSGATSSSPTASCQPLP
ncbi:hypothetical protein KP509_18G049000 [Ceratopteris richardii]|uniref:Serine aminopeptidase S33 domain-containing protein n=1 Tax=Ceratopteris richardii TaxID=49495 RepID=A0A8T2SQ69_CERRI|nr:hypothetical protein KP509_18G049000 [Ceratopteris richardii]